MTKTKEVNHLNETNQNYRRCISYYSPVKDYLSHTIIFIYLNHRKLNKLYKTFSIRDVFNPYISKDEELPLPLISDPGLLRDRARHHGLRCAYRGWWACRPGLSD